MPAKGKTRKRRSRDRESSEEEEESDVIDFKAIKRNGALKHDFEHLCTSAQYEHPEMLEEIDPKEFNLQLFERNGLVRPLVFHCKPEELGMKMPDPETFSEDDVLEMVGAKREVEVVVVEDQSSRSIPLSSMIDYFKHPEGRDLTNMLSLEFSLTKLRDHVSGPSVVNEIDWVNKYYPDEMFTRSVSFGRKSTFTFNHSHPGVQRYCLMSTAGCYTDFHLDFGGTSVWYHVLKGEKVFFMVEPDLQNMRMYDEWQRNYDHSGWFGDIVSKCTRMVLKQGDTAILPSGWLHAVYTPVKSLVFGGNFLHSYAAAMQCKVHSLEQKLRIGVRYRYPHFEELNFYVITKIVEDCTGRKYLRPIGRTRDLEYVGREWIAEGGHRIPITWDYYKNKMKQQRLAKLQDPSSTPPETVQQEDDPLVFYDPLVLRPRGRSHNHKDPIPLESEISLNQDELDKISAHLLVQYEAMLEYFFVKKCVDLPDFITRPSSLLYCFQAVLRERRRQLTESGVTLPSPPDIYTPPTIAEQFTMSEEPKDEPRADSPCSSRSEELGNFDDNSMMMDSTETKSLDPANVTETDEAEDTPSTEKDEDRSSRPEEGQEEIDQESKDNEVQEHTDEKAEMKSEEPGAKSEEPEAKSEEPETKSEDAETKLDKPEEELDTAENNSTKKENPVKEKSHRASKANSTLKSKKSQSEKKRKDRPSFDEALHSPKAKKKYDPKKDKPEFVGGIPVTPIQSGPAVPNAYNYDPMQEITKLGTGQLRSTYRKSQYNVAPPKQTKIYKLEHKLSSEHPEAEEDTNNLQGDNINTGKPLPRAPGTSFIPDLNIPITPRIAPNEMYSPTAPRTDYERRFSTGSVDKAESGIRERTISFDSYPSPVKLYTGEMHAPFIPPLDSANPRSMSHIPSKDNSVDFFLKNAPLLIQKLNAIGQK